jgi:CHAT domain-containing protein
LLAAQVQVGRVDSLGWIGRYDEALALAARLEAQLLALGADRHAANVLINLGGLHFRRDRYAEALDCNLRALEIIRPLGDPVEIAEAEANCANQLTYLGRIEEAIALYERVRETFAANDLAEQAAKLEANIGYLHYVSGRYAAALAAQMRARSQLAALGKEAETAQIDSLQGDSYRALNLYPEALECYGRAIGTLERLGVDDERARCGLGFAAVLMALGRFTEAFDALERAEAIFRRQNNGLQRAHARLLRAYLLRATGETEEACAEARAAAAALIRYGLPGWAAEARFLPADVARERGSGDPRALLAVSRAAQSAGHGWLHCRAERALGLTYEARGRATEAIRHLRAGVTALEQARTLVAPEDLHVAFLRDKLAVYEDLVRLLILRRTPQDLAEALEYVERSKSRLLLERVQTALDNRMPRQEGPVREAQVRLAAIRAELTRAYYRAQPFDREEARSLSGGAISLLDLETLERSYRDALRESEMMLPGAATGLSILASVVAPTQLQAMLRPDEAIVEFYFMGETVTAFVVTSHELRVCPHLAAIAEVEYALRRLRYQLQRVAINSEYMRRHSRQMQASVEEALQRLYKLLLLPLERWLDAGKLVVIPHGALHGLPFHACHDGTRYALDRWEITYAPSAAIWYAGAERRRDGTPQNTPLTEGEALVMGIPWPGIDRVAQEVEQVARLLPQSTRYCAEEATLPAFRAHAGRCRLIHLATHALFRADNPLFSGLRFADGWLLARDLYDAALDCDLVTLSACQTGAAGVEPGDELFGLIRGFLHAGARSLNVSLWPADDGATTDLMARFYTELTCGASRASALRSAQQSLRDRYPHPYYWAAFALVGES